MRTKQVNLAGNDVEQEVVVLAKADGTILEDLATQTTLALVATEATLVTVHDHEHSIDAKITACNTGAVTIAGSALPSGAATEATLGTVHGHVDSIDGKITACNTGAIAGSLTQSTKHDGATYKTARIDGAATLTVVAAVANKVIKVHAWNLTAQGTVLVIFKSGAAGTKISKEFKFQDREGDNSSFAPYPACHFQTAAGALLELYFNAAVTVTGTIIYTDADAS